MEGERSMRGETYHSPVRHAIDARRREADRRRFPRAARGLRTMVSLVRRRGFIAPALTFSRALSILCDLSDPRRERLCGRHAASVRCARRESVRFDTTQCNVAAERG